MATTNRGPNTRSQKLLKKPLAEAILEVQWKLVDNKGLQTDPGFKVLFGRFYDRIRKDYPKLQNLPVAEVPEAMAPRVARHQFRSSTKGWPLVQLGPGILTVNETKGYSWQDFQRRLEQAIEILIDTYPTDLSALSLTQTRLRYINAIPIDQEDRAFSALDFLEQKLHTKLSLEPKLFEATGVSKKPHVLRFEAGFPVKDPQGSMTVILGLGTSQNIPSIIWELQFTSTDSVVPQQSKAVKKWIEDAHTVVDNWFFTLSEGELVQSFKGTK